MIELIIKYLKVIVHPATHWAPTCLRSLTSEYLDTVEEETETQTKNYYIYCDSHIGRTPNITWAGQGRGLPGRDIPHMEH